MAAIRKLTIEDIQEIKKRRDSGEAMISIAKDFNICEKYILPVLRKHYGDIPNLKNRHKMLPADIIEIYKQDKLTLQGIQKTYKVGRDTVYRAFKNVDFKYSFKLTYSQAQNKGSYSPELLEKARTLYNTTYIKNKSEFGKSLGICPTKIFGILKDVTPYVETKNFKDLVIETYKKEDSIKRTCEALKIEKIKVTKILHEAGLAIRKILPKELKPKRVRKKKETSDTEPKRKLKVIRRVKKDSKRVKLPHELPKMQQGEVKVKKNEKVLKTLPEEVRNKGYKLRIDDKTEIYVKDGVSPEVARERFLKRYSNNYKF